MDSFAESPVFGKGAGFRSWVMGENGFELSTFAPVSYTHLDVYKRQAPGKA